MDSIKQKTALLTRFGGCGDMAPVQVVATQLKKRGYHVTFAVRCDEPAMRIADMFIGNPAFDLVLDFKQIGPWHNRCIKTALGWLSIESIYDNFDLVIDFMNVVENNNTSPYPIPSKPENIWQTSRNSNWANWFDMHLAWANIDPTSVPDSEKRPLYVLTEQEKTEFLKIKAKYDKVFVIQTSASSLSRTWYQGEKLKNKLLEAYPNSAVFYWEDQNKQWTVTDKDGTRIVSIPGLPPLRVSMCLVYISDLFIGADTGFTHVAEGLDKKHIALYSTVPGWTRNKYYKYQTEIDPGKDNPELYTFNLGLGDPLRVLEGDSSLSEREKALWTMYSTKVPLEAACEALNTSKQGVEIEINALLTKKQSFEHQQSKALSAITVDMVLAKVSEVLNA